MEMEEWGRGGRGEQKAVPVQVPRPGPQAFCSESEREGLTCRLLARGIGVLGRVGEGRSEEKGFLGGREGMGIRAAGGAPSEAGAKEQPPLIFQPLTTLRTRFP